MAQIRFTTRCGHSGSIWTKGVGEGNWKWEVQGPKVGGEEGDDGSRRHNGESGGNRLYVKIAIARYLGISATTIDFHKLASATSTSASTRPLQRTSLKTTNQIIAENSPTKSPSRQPKDALKNLQRMSKTTSTRKKDTKANSATTPKVTAKHKVEWSPKLAKCRVCKEKILKGDLRAGKYSVWKGSLRHNVYYHLDCCPESFKRRLFPPNKNKDDGDDDDVTKNHQPWKERVESELEDHKQKRRRTIEVERKCLRKRLRKLRTKLHEEEGTKKDGRCLIISLETIDNIVYSMPTTQGALMNVKGIGKCMMKRYGQALLQEVQKYANQL